MKPARFVNPYHCQEYIQEPDGKFQKCGAELLLMPAEIPVVTDEGDKQGTKIVYVCSACKRIICS